MLKLALKSPPAQTVDVSPLTPDRLHGLSRSEIGAICLSSGNRTLLVDELFTIDGSGALELVFEDSCDRLTHIGCGMSVGRITVEGGAGGYLGIGMRGGAITVGGSAAAWAGCAMTAGLVHIRGDAGDFAGAALPGERHGMQGGSLVVDGRAGDRAGDRMRRGLLLIKGDAGAYCGSRMLAGTIVVRGKAGFCPGLGMKRGTLLLSAPTQVPATFNDCGVHTFAFLTLMQRRLASASGAYGGFGALGNRVRRYSGDIANDGRGEILITAASA